MYTAAAAALCAALLSGCEGTSAAFFVSGSGKESGRGGGTAGEPDGSYGAETDAGREPETSRPLEKETMPQIDYEALENWFGDGSSGGGSGSGDASDPAGNAEHGPDSDGRGDSGSGGRGGSGSGGTGGGDSNGSGGGNFGPGEGIAGPDSSGPGALSVRDKNVQSRVVIATDVHYLADQLADGKCESFMEMAEESDGRVLPYLWEITDAFFDEVSEIRPDVLIVSGDLTMEGEKLSHQEFAEKLGSLEDEGIQVLVIPGNHDINNGAAKGYREDTIYPTASDTAGELAQIYEDYGYLEAEERDGYSLSYVYKLDDYFQFLMLDSCQYDPVNLVGGALENETYEWAEGVLEKSWETGVRTIPVTHHNLLDQSGVSKAFFDNCTIMHSESLLGLLSDNDVKLHLSGHLHIQHYREESGVSEVVTGSLLMEPFQYGVIDILRNGDIHYYSRQVDVEGWANDRGMKNPELLDFESYARHYMWEVNWEKAYRELTAKVQSGDVYLTGDEGYRMALYYAAVCENYYAGTMYKVIGEAKADPAYELWMDIEFTTETSSFLDNILQDSALNYTDSLIKY